MDRKVYYIKKKSTPTIIIYDFISKLIELGAEDIDIKLEPIIFENPVRPDAYIGFKLKDPVNRTISSYHFFLEVDYKNYNSDSKMRRYESIARAGSVQEVLHIKEFPTVIVARHSDSINYKPINFAVVYTNFEFTNLMSQILFLDREEWEHYPKCQ